MKEPSRLVKNRFGLYYYCVVFPSKIRDIINKEQARRSLRTTDRVIATMMAREFRQVTLWIFKRIEYHDMKWNEVKKIMDKTADDLFRKYVERVDEVGFSFRDENTLDSVMPAAKNFLFNDSEMYHTDGIPVTNEDGLTVGYDPVYTSREEYERLVDTKKEITQLVDGILEANSIDLSKGSPEYKQFCRQTLEMLHRLDKQKAEYRQQAIHGLPQTIIQQPQSVLHGTPSPSISLRELIEKYIHHKDVIEKTWAAKTKKDNSEILYRILEMFEMVVGEPNPDINTLNREHARLMKEVLALIPSNLNKKAKFRNRPLKDIIDDSRKGLVSEDERITSVTFNNYATLITAIFSYAKIEDYIHENYFENMVSFR